MKKTSFIALAALVFIPLFVFAQESPTFVPLTNLPGINESAASDTLPSFFNNLYRLCIGAAAVIAVLQIMRAGMYFMFNKGSIAHNEKGKKLITDSVLGLLLVLSPAIVFTIINPDILDLKLDFGRLKLPDLDQEQIGDPNGASVPPTQPATGSPGSNDGYGWKGLVANEVGGKVSTSPGEWGSPGPAGRGTTQQACLADYDRFINSFVARHPRWTMELTCNCSTACRN